MSVIRGVEVYRIEDDSEWAAPIHVVVDPNDDERDIIITESLGRGDGVYINWNHLNELIDLLGEIRHKHRPDSQVVKVLTVPNVDLEEIIARAGDAIP